MFHSQMSNMYQPRLSLNLCSTLGCQAGVYAATWPKEYGGTPPEGHTPLEPNDRPLGMIRIPNDLTTAIFETFSSFNHLDFDFFHDLILVDELARCGAGASNQSTRSCRFDP